MRNCFMHKNFVASAKLVDAYNDFLPVATIGSLDVSEVPAFFPPVNGEPIKISLRGISGFSQIIRRIIIISDGYLICTKGAEKEFLSRKPAHWQKTCVGCPTDNPNENAIKWGKKYAAEAGFLTPNWTSEYHRFLVANSLLSI